MELPTFHISDRLRLRLLHDVPLLIEFCDRDGAWKPAMSTKHLFPEIILKNGEQLFYKNIERLESSEAEYRYEDAHVAINSSMKVDPPLKKDLPVLSMHFLHSGTFKKSTKVKFIRCRWQFLQAPLAFTWTPHLNPNPEYVIGDHAFRSPAVVVATRHFAVTIVPDLDVYKLWPLIARQAMHLQVSSPEHPLESGTIAEFWHGYCNYVPYKHVFFRHKSNSCFVVKPNDTFSLAYNLLFFIGDDLDRRQVLGSINEYLWRKYAQSRLGKLEPQVIPFEEYVSKIFPVPFEKHGAWREWTANGQECGGTFIRSWMGRFKRKWHETSPNQIEQAIKANQRGFERLNAGLNERLNFAFTNVGFIRFIDLMGRTLVRLTRDAQVWNQAWFMNVRSAYGLCYFAQVLSKPDWKRYALAMIRGLVYSPAPAKSQLDLFPAVTFPSEQGVSWVEGTRAFLLSHYYGLYDTALGCYWLLKFYQDCQEIPEILPRVKKIVKTLLSFQQADGHFPSYVKIEGETCTIDPALENSANCAAILMLLGEYYKISKDETILPPAKRLADFLLLNILPTNRWHDFESFYSCTHFPLDFFDHISQNHVNNTLCIYWTAEGLKGLYEATGESKYLDAGLAVLQVLSMYQQVWTPPFLRADLFGGFASQNADAEWSDARQALFVSTYAEYYILTRDPQWMERAIAALRACFALALIPENENIAPGIFQGVKPTTRPGQPDFGVVSENYGHQGLDFRTMGYYMPDWGAFSSGYAAAYMQKHFGDLFLDFEAKLAWGINGILVKSAEFTQGEVNLRIQTVVGKVALVVKGIDLEGDNVRVKINGLNHGDIPIQRLMDGFSIKLIFDS